jgi:predicted house-cleaning noncanonical NTP pyrophosphatase (MazG superfamily)/uracil-DNA glycosylase
MRKNYDKLIRDRIPEIMDANGIKYETEVLNDRDYVAALKAKVLEEAREVSEASPEELVKEIGDLLEVLEALRGACDVDEDLVERIRIERRRVRGGFERRLRLLWTDDGKPEPSEVRPSMLGQSHIKPLIEWVDSVREVNGLPRQVPLPDPLDGGVNARLLVLLEAPGPKAVESGYISMDNPDPTARNLKRFLHEAGIERRCVLLWNIVPWYLAQPGSKKIRAPRKAEMIEGGPILRSLLDRLPRLEAVLLLGNQAKRGWELIAPACAAPVLSTFHPSNRVFSIDKTRIDEARRAFRSASELMRSSA